MKKLMKRMGIEEIYRSKRKKKIENGEKVYKYMMRGMEIKGKKKVWEMEIK